MDGQEYGFPRRSGKLGPAWSLRSLRGLEPVYLWVDGIYVKAGLEKETAALLVVVAGLRDGRKVVLAIGSEHRESGRNLGSSATGSTGAGMRTAAGDRRRPPGDLGGARGDLARGGVATMLEPQAAQRARCTAEEEAE